MGARPGSPARIALVVLALGILAATARRSPSPARSLSGPPVAGSWHLSFEDGFSGTSLDPAKWSTCYDWDCTNGGNPELEWYQAQNVTVGGGSAHLTARRQDANGKPYTSGLIQSNEKYVFRYGYAEAAMWLPAGRGLWPAFWLLPSDISASTPEIDVMEAFGDEPSTITMTLHGVKGQDQSRLSGADFTAGYHTFGIDWEPSRITWYVDGVRRKVVNASYDKPMYLLADLAIAGSRPPTPSTPFPSTLNIDYIRVWSR